MWYNQTMIEMRCYIWLCHVCLRHILANLHIGLLSSVAVVHKLGGGVFECVFACECARSRMGRRSVLENAQLDRRAWTFVLRACLEKQIIVVFGNVLGEGRESTHATECGGVVGTWDHTICHPHMENKSLCWLDGCSVELVDSVGFGISSLKSTRAIRGFDRAEELQTQLPSTYCVRAVGGWGCLVG